MPMSTTAKIALGVFAGGVTVVGIGAGVAHARKKKARGMKRDDGERPDASERRVVEIDLAPLIDGPDIKEIPVDVGARYELRFPTEVAAEFAAGRRIGSVHLAKLVNGEPQSAKSWEVSTESYEVTHNDVIVGFDSERQRMVVTFDRAGRYVVAQMDRDGAEILDELVFYATSPRQRVAA